MSSSRSSSPPSAGHAEKETTDLEMPAKKVASGADESTKCFKCGGQGHYSRECPETSNAPSARACFKCGEAGHLSRDCTQATAAPARSDKACFNCGGPHLARECTQAGGNSSRGGYGGGGRGGGAGAGAGDRACFSCGETGHMSRDCTNPPKAGSSLGLSCYTCGGPHLAKDCDKKSASGYGGRGAGRGGYGAPAGGRGGGSASTSCFNCGGAHFARDCNEPRRDGGQRRDRDASAGTCYRCNEPGHQSKNCPTYQRQAQICYLCRKEGHLAKDCTQGGDNSYNKL